MPSASVGCSLRSWLVWDGGVVEFVLSPLTSISYGVIAPQNRPDSKTSLKWSVLRSALLGLKYVLMSHITLA